MRIVDCVQGTQEWLSARLGIVTASEADALVSPTYQVRKGEGVESYLNRKLAERLLRRPAQMYVSPQMECGHILEEEVIPALEFQNNIKLDRVGFVVRDDIPCGASPDALEYFPGETVAPWAGWEIKCPEPHTHIGYLRAGAPPAAYKVQLQFSMYVCDVSHWVFVSYARGLPMLNVVLKRDPEAQDAIAEALLAFNDKLDAEYKKLVNFIQGDK